MIGRTHSHLTHAERSAREAAGEYPAEQPGTGSNEYQYFVCNTLGEAALTRLPDTRPEHIRAARALKRFLVGHLDAPVSTYPPFPWTEAAYLRAQIARISATTVLAPSGWFTQEEDDSGASAVVPAEEQEALPMPEEDLDSWLANWVHLCVAACRCISSSCHLICLPVVSHLKLPGCRPVLPPWFDPHNPAAPSVKCAPYASTSTSLRMLLRHVLLRGAVGCLMNGTPLIHDRSWTRRLFGTHSRCCREV